MRVITLAILTAFIVALTALAAARVDTITWRSIAMLCSKYTRIFSACP